MWLDVDARIIPSTVQMIGSNRKVLDTQARVRHL